MVVYALVTLGLLVYAGVELTRTPAAQVRTLSKPMWFLLMLVVPLLGAVAWLLFGRPKASVDPALAPPARPIAPDDDEDFLRELHRRSRDPRDDAA